MSFPRLLEFSHTGPLADARTKYLQALFDSVCDASDWKAPVVAVVPVEMVSDVKQAVAFMTATDLEIRGRRWIGQHEYLDVYAAGYRAGPAGP